MIDRIVTTARVFAQHYRIARTYANRTTSLKIAAWFATELAR